MKTFAAIALLLATFTLAAPSRACLESEVQCGDVCCSHDCCSGGPCETGNYHFYCVRGYTCLNDGSHLCLEATGHPEAPKVVAQRSPTDDDAPRSCALGHGVGTAGSFGLVLATTALALARRRRRLGAPRT